MKVGVIGTGYVGLVSGVCLAAKGHDVICVDIDPKIADSLNKGIPHLYEKGLPELLKEVIDAGRFGVTIDINSVLEGADTILIAVGTPSERGVIDLRYVRTAARSIGNYLRNADRHISIVVKSTVIPGTTDTIVRQEIEDAAGKSHPSFGLGMNPEFLREGEAIGDFMFPDRIVLGSEDERTLERLEELYAPWDVDKVRVNTRTAELIKYANNTLLAMQISGINEIANLAAAIGNIDTLDVVRGIGLDKRWNPIVDGRRANPQILTYLIPGCGFGGSCFPKDVQALRSQGEAIGLQMRMLNAILDVNTAQPLQVIEALERYCQEGLGGAKVLLLGLAFKSDTDDVRESASLRIAEALVERNVAIAAHDPVAAENFKRLLGSSARKMTFVENWKDKVSESDVIIIATKWPEYEALSDMNLNGKLLFDARRLLSKDHANGARYLSIGLG
jgi:UDPglucose 6-dehydrogenase/GDP-mannose 6-dehydrogenase